MEFLAMLYTVLLVAICLMMARLLPGDKVDQIAPPAGWTKPTAKS